MLFNDQNMLRYFGKCFSENHGLLCQLFAISKTKLSPNLYDFAFVGNRKRQILDRAHFLEFSFSSTEDTFQYNSAQSPFRFQQHLWLSLSLNLSFFSLVAQQYCFILGPDSRSLEGLLEIQTYFPPERNFVKSQTLGVLFR